MAHSVILYNGTGYWLDLLDSAAHKVLYGADVSSPTIESFFAQPYGRGFLPLAGYRVGNREITLPVLLSGSTMDGLIVNIQQVQAVLEQTRRYHANDGGSPAYLAVQPNGAANTTVFDVMDGRLEAGKFFNPALASFKVLDAQLRLTVRSYGRSQQLRKNTSGTLNNLGGTGVTGGTWTLTMPSSGEIPAPMKVELQTAAGDTYIRAIVAAMHGNHVSDFVKYFILQCEEGSHTGYTVTDIEADADFSAASAAVAAASGGNVERVTSSGACTHTGNLLRWNLTGPLGNLRGVFDIWLRVDNPAQAGAGAAHQFGLKYGGSDGLLISNDLITLDTGTSDAMYYMGQVTIPTPGNQGGIDTFLMVLSYTHAFAAGAQAYDLDCLVMIPVTGDTFHVETLDVKFSAATTAQDILIADNLLWRPQTYLTASDGTLTLLQPSIPWLDSGFNRGVDGDTLFLPLLLSGSSPYTNDLTHQFTLTAYDYPRFGLFDA